jgi:hypothetical protein
MERSTIYIKCPRCGKNGLLTEMQGKYLCALCMFDYTTLKDDPDKLDAVLIENMKLKGFGPVYAIALYQRVTLTPAAEANIYLQKLAEKNSMDTFQGHGIFANFFDWWFKMTRR